MSRRLYFFLEDSSLGIKPNMKEQACRLALYAAGDHVRLQIYVPLFILVPLFWSVVVENN